MSVRTRTVVCYPVTEQGVERVQRAVVEFIATHEDMRQHIEESLHIPDVLALSEGAQVAAFKDTLDLDFARAFVEAGVVGCLNLVPVYDGWAEECPHPECHRHARSRVRVNGEWRYGCEIHKPYLPQIPE